MRVALSVGTVRIPPTYFVLQHAERLDGEASLFALVAEVTDPALRTPVHAAVPGAGLLSFRQREVLEPLFLRRMARMIARYRPDVVHQHTGTWTLPAVRASRRTGAPLVTTLHGADVFLNLRPVTTVMQRWHRKNFRAAARASRVVLPVSKFLADRAADAGVPRHRLIVHYQGVDTDVFTPGPMEERDLPVVTHVGALHRRKGVHDLVAASLALADVVPHELHLIGTGPLRDDVAAQARTHQHIKLRGALDRTQVRDALRASDIFVLATQEHEGWREAAGLVTLEAQACGVPVVVNDSGGASEMLVRGETGLLAREKDVESLTETLRAMLEMPAEERRDMGRRGREFVESRRSTAHAVAELEDIYRSLTP
ncbi:glycosyltransferase family 4 protein [Georgenia sp. EYE_87]|uniref:glycosyltransferase family 4 protein n=1 Tax=Georgenia sp. EYE_87 TaxID=2853448 RepID=UPI0020061B9D|nr:glycosyltransferase family 4 protein [Georgenia sp. EYE_87]MCK6211760.1 glycosyltransferase family 4 protein [Georgenia sp. EYE_87]